MDEWVREQYRATYCDKNGVQRISLNMDKFRTQLQKQRPESATEIIAALKRLHIDVCAALCKRFPLDEYGRFQNCPTVISTIKYMRGDMQESVIKSVVKNIEQQNIAAVAKQMKSSTTSNTTLTAPKHPVSVPQTVKIPTSLINGDETRIWINQQYLSQGFNRLGFIGWKKFTSLLVNQKPSQSEEINALLTELRVPGRPHSLEDPGRVTQSIAASRRYGGVQIQQVSLQSAQSHKPTPAVVNQATIPANASAVERPKHTWLNEDDLLARKMKGLEVVEDQTQISSATTFDSEYSCNDETIKQKPDFDLMDQMLSNKGKALDVERATQGLNRDISHAPLLSHELIATHAQNLVPQFGLLGSCSDIAIENRDTKMFLNTNVPFSAFICGVQGSGKSHTTACILENALIPSPNLGCLQSPVSALVFSYGEFSNGGSGFNVSEAAFLATANQSFPGQRVKKITVLTSPSNPAIKKFYQRLPNLEVIPFKLKAGTLDVSTLLTLMAVNEKSEVPLYMAKVESILRAIATENEDGVFDYELFKQKLALEDFDPKQTNMLEMRLGLLESFLDKEGNVPEPKYRPGEVTIVDLSDAFVTPNTACILFKLVLERFMQSSAPGKMVVLDEAHKYMLNTPGSKVLNNYLITLIRLQRHKGARVIISTQEPTVSTDLIALCSVTVIHRFTSPTWYAALRKHISAMENETSFMQQIEGLETGEALVYSPNAVLGKNEDGSLCKATGRLLMLNIRNRLTIDGGESIMAV